MVSLEEEKVVKNFTEVRNRAISGEIINISTPRQVNLVIISENEFQELQKAKRNEEYLRKIDNSINQIRNGDVVIKTMDELRNME